MALNSAFYPLNAVGEARTKRMQIFESPICVQKYLHFTFPIFYQLHKEPYCSTIVQQQAKFSKLSLILQRFTCYRFKCSNTEQTRARIEPEQNTHHMRSVPLSPGLNFPDVITFLTDCPTWWMCALWRCTSGLWMGQANEAPMKQATNGDGVTFQLRARAASQQYAGD